MNEVYRDDNCLEHMIMLVWTVMSFGIQRRPIFRCCCWNSSQSSQAADYRKSHDF